MNKLNLYYIYVLLDKNFVVLQICYNKKISPSIKIFSHDVNFFRASSSTYLCVAGISLSLFSHAHTGWAFEHAQSFFKAG